MGGFFGVASRDDCVADLFYGTDYHSHLGTSRGGMVVYVDIHEGPPTLVESVDIRHAGLVDQAVQALTLLSGSGRL